MNRLLGKGLLGIFIGAAALLAPARADEGMWLPDQPPRELLKKQYDFDITDAWLERVRKASVRFNNGGSGGFVSADGLILTNHHIGAEFLQKISGKDKDYYRDGFYARTQAEEMRCPALELNVLQSIEDVTARVEDAVKPDLPPAKAFAARRAVLAAIEKESFETTKLRSDVVTLFRGGKYHLYRYQKYTDVRMVMAPEHAIAFFGGDTDNFEYPRYNLDICFFRAYENDKPVRVKHYFKWSTEGPAAGDLVFVSGHPGSTNRLDTLARLEHRRDVALPAVLGRIRSLEAMLGQFSERGPEYERMARKDLHRIANARKAYSGQYQGLLDPAVLERKAKEELALREAIAQDPTKEKAYGAAWHSIEGALKALHEFRLEYSLLEVGNAFDCDLFRIARHLVRLAEEKKKANSDRLREYRDSNLDSLELSLFSSAPIHPALERVKLAHSLTYLCERLGGGHPLVVKALAGKSPAERAAMLVNGSSLGDPEIRRRLAKGGLAAILETHDPMILLAREFDPAARALRLRHENEVEEVERQAYGLIAKARYEVEGARKPPDATFTLRLAYGVVKGYRDEGADLPYTTTFGGIYDRAEQQGHRAPFVLPERWRAGKDKIDLTTPFNFVSTSDTIGGNSGSPVLNRAGELVGVNFDRNRHGLVRNFVYTEEQARHIAVHSKGILEALRRLYDAGPLVKELTEGHQ